MGGNAQSKNSIKNIVENQVNTTMQSKTNQSVNLACNNVQEVVNSKGCNVNFAKQSCDVYGLANVASSSTFDSQVTQSVIQDIKQRAESSNEGLILGLQNSNSSNLVNMFTRMGIDTVMAFQTDCSKNISGLNLQSVRNTTCDVQNEINFAAQEITGKVMGDCVTENVAKSSATQTLSQIFDQTAKSVNKGINPFILLMMIIAIIGALIILPIMMKAMASLGRPPRNPAERRSASARKFAVFMTTILLLLMALWWPGLGAALLGMTPWPYTGDTSPDAVCRQSEPVDRSIIINEFMWWDEDCVAPGPEGACTDEKRAKHYKSCGVFSGKCDDPSFVQDRDRYREVQKACSALQKTMPINLEYCRPQDIAVGLFSTARADVRLPDDTPGANVDVRARADESIEEALRFAEEQSASEAELHARWEAREMTPPPPQGMSRTKFNLMQAQASANANAAGVVQARASNMLLDLIGVSGNALNRDKINNELMARERREDAENAMHKAAKIPYIGCKRCSDDPSNILYGTWVDADKSCDPQQIDLLTYLTPEGEPCEGGSELEFCKSSISELVAASPNDCTEPAYQERKRRYSKALRACAVVNEKSARPSTSEEIVPLEEQCPSIGGPVVFDYVKCNSSTKQCAYIPKECVCPEGLDTSLPGAIEKCNCSGVAEDVIDACKNSFASCQDPDYLVDLGTYNSWNERCTAEFDTRWKLNTIGIPVTILVYLVIFAAIFRLMMKAMEPQYPDGTSAIAMLALAGDRGRGVGFNDRMSVRTGTQIGLALLFILVIVSGGFLLSVSKSDSGGFATFRREYTTMERGDGDIPAYIMMGVGGALFVLWFFYVIYIRNTRRRTIDQMRRLLEEE